MSIVIDDLVRYVTLEEVYEYVVSRLEAAEIPARSWRPGGVARSVVGALSDVGSQGSRIVTDCVRGGFLLFAGGTYLRAHAKDVYDVDFLPATQATGEVTLTNAGGATHTVGANELVVRVSGTNKRFRVTEAFVLAANSVLTVDIEAIEPGAASSVSPNEIDELEVTLAKVSVTNAAAIVGRDAEADPALVQRCLLKKGTWSPFGPRDAYEYAALSAKLAGDVPTNITRVVTSPYSSRGQVRTILATPSGTPTSPEIAAVVEEIERKARPSSVTSLVSGAVPLPTTHEITLWAKGGTEAIVRERAEIALSALISSWPIGGVSKTDGGQGYFFADALAAALIGSSPEAFDVDGVGSDIAQDFDEVVTNTTTLTVRIR
jgi:hypothetical protein